MSNTVTAAIGSAAVVLAALVTFLGTRYLAREDRIPKAVAAANTAVEALANAIGPLRSELHTVRADLAAAMSRIDHLETQLKDRRNLEGRLQFLDREVKALRSELHDTNELLAKERERTSHLERILIDNGLDVP